MHDIIENATIIYKNGLKKNCEAISITEKGIYTGFIKSKNNHSEDFIDSGFIPIKYIEEILFITKGGIMKKRKIGGIKKKIGKNKM